MLSKPCIGESLGRLSLLKRFPNNPKALVALAEILEELCKTDEQLAALVREILQTCDEWCGPATLRDVQYKLLNPGYPYVRG